MLGGRVGCWGDLRVGHGKNMALKGGQKKKNTGFKRGGGGSTKKSFKFYSEGICDNANSLPDPGCSNVG